MPTAIVTGAAGNLGLAVVERLLADGYRVAGATGKRGGGVSAHENYKPFIADLSNEGEADRFIKDASAFLAAIDVAVLTVGGFVMGDLSSTSSADIEQQLQLNFYSAYHVARPVFLEMLTQGHGRIFLTGSIAGEHISKSRATVAYGLSKSLLFNLASLLNAEAGKQDVFTSVIVPSIIDTPQNRKSMPDADTSKWIAPDEIASVIAWHAGPQALHLRQEVIRITG